MEEKERVGGKMTSIREEKGEEMEACPDQEEERKVLATFALFGEILAGQSQSKRKENQEVNQLAEKQF